LFRLFLDGSSFKPSFLLKLSDLRPKLSNFTITASSPQPKFCSELLHFSMRSTQGVGHLDVTSLQLLDALLLIGVLDCYVVPAAP
jgi:hypothetical protein